MTLKSKVYLLIGSQFLLFLTIIFTTVYLYWKFESKSEIEYAKLNLIQTYEYIDIFSTEKDELCITKFHESIDQIRNIFKNDMLFNIRILEEIDIYQNNFTKYSKAYIDRGLNENSGIEGKFRDVIHEVEDIVKKDKFSILRSDILEIRRREKDFILREDPKYIIVVEKNIQDLIKKINRSELSTDQKNNIQKKLEFYLYNFNKLTKKILELGQLKHSLNNNYHQLKIELSEKIFKAQNNIKELLIIVGSVFLITTFLFLFFTTKISLNIIKPIISLRDQITTITENNLYDRVKIDQNDELGDLETSFNNMLNHVQTAYHNIEESNKYLESRVKKRTKELTNQINEKNLYQ